MRGQMYERVSGAPRRKDRYAKTQRREDIIYIYDNKPSLRVLASSRTNIHAKTQRREDIILYMGHNLPFASLRLRVPIPLPSPKT